MKKNINYLTNRCLDISFNENAPLVKWLHLGVDNKTELGIFNLVYCWLFILDHDLLELKDENIEYYIYYSFLRVKNQRPNWELEDYLEVYTDRYIKFKDELKQKRRNLQYFPLYFYGRICNSPLEMTDIKSFDNSYLHWSEYDLTHMFPHQMNFLEDELESIL